MFEEVDHTVKINPLDPLLTQFPSEATEAGQALRSKGKLKCLLEVDNYNRLSYAIQSKENRKDKHVRVVVSTHHSDDPVKNCGKEQSDE